MAGLARLLAARTLRLRRRSGDGGGLFRRGHDGFRIRGPAVGHCPGALGGRGGRLLPFRLTTKHLPRQLHDRDLSRVQLLAQRPVLLAEPERFSLEYIVGPGVILNRGAQDFHFLPPLWPRLTYIGGVSGSELGLRSGPLAIAGERAVEVATIACHGDSLTPSRSQVQLDYAPWGSQTVVERAFSCLLGHPGTL